MIAGSAFESLKLAHCSDSEFVLFVGLIVKADDDGRGEGDPLAIKMKFPNRKWNPKRIEAMMTTLSDVKLTYWYHCGCGMFYEVVDFEDYQQGSWMGIHRKASKLPSIGDEHCQRCNTALVLVSGDTTKIREGKVSKDKMVTVFDSDFEDWWRRYPRKVGKVKARTCYVQLRSEGVPADLLADALTAYTDELRDNDTEVRFIKHPATFLGPDKHYEDYARMKGWGEK